MKEAVIGITTYEPKMVKTLHHHVENGHCYVCYGNRIWERGINARHPWSHMQVEAQHDRICNPWGAMAV